MYLSSSRAPSFLYLDTCRTAQFKSCRGLSTASFSPSVARPSRGLTQALYRGSRVDEEAIVEGINGNKDVQGERGGEKERKRNPMNDLKSCEGATTKEGREERT